MQRVIKAAAEHINSISIVHKHLLPDLMALVVEPKFKSVRDVRGEKQWLRRYEIVTAGATAEICKIQESILSFEIQNTRPSTIELVFKLFGVPGDPIVDRTTAAYLNEIGERRNAVSHGRESASEVGGRFTSLSLEERLTSVDRQITLVIVGFEEMAKRKTFIKPNCRRFYTS